MSRGHPLPHKHINIHPGIIMFFFCLFVFKSSEQIFLWTPLNSLNSHDLCKRSGGWDNGLLCPQIFLAESGRIRTFNDFICEALQTPQAKAVVLLYNPPKWISFVLKWATGYITALVFWFRRGCCEQSVKDGLNLGLRICRATYHLGTRQGLFYRFSEPQREAGWFNFAINMFSVTISHGNLFIAPLLHLSPLIFCPWINPSTPPLQHWGCDCI